MTSRSTEARLAGRCYQCHVARPLAAGKLRCALCLEKAVERNRRKRTSPDFVASESARVSEWNRRNPERRKAAFKKEQRELKRSVRERYGGVCKCCGERRPEFLTIDHVDGGGSAHRKQVGCVYRWLKRQGFPSGFQVLCYNCNCAKGFFGRCPHEAERQKSEAEQASEIGRQ